LAASRFLAKPIQKSFAGFGFWLISPSARAQDCTLAGGSMRKSEENKPPVGGMSGLALGTSPRQPSRAALSPISYIAAFAWCPTARRGTDDCGEQLPPAPRPPGSPGTRDREGSKGAREYPMCAEGWALWVVGGSPDLFLATGGTYRLGKPSGRTSRAGLLLGRLGGVSGAYAPRSRLPTALWGIQEGKADVTRGETGERRTSCAATRAPCPPTQ
jgi:hypothetical protein